MLFRRSLLGLRFEKCWGRNHFLVGKNYLLLTGQIGFWVIPLKSLVLLAVLAPLRIPGLVSSFHVLNFGLYEFYVPNVYTTYTTVKRLVGKLFQLLRAVFLQFFHRSLLATRESKCITAGALGALSRPEVATGNKKCFFGLFCFIFKICAVS